jgi:hypothetical protein
MVVGPIQTMLGLNLDTNKLIVAIPGSYVSDAHDLINTTWHKNCRTFIVSEAKRLTEKVVCLAEGAPWVYHLLTHLCASIAYSLAKNKRLLLESSQDFRDIVLSLCTGSFPCSSKYQVRTFHLL